MANDEAAQHLGMGLELSGVTVSGSRESYLSKACPTAEIYQENSIVDAILQMDGGDPTSGDFLLTAYPSHPGHDSGT